MVVTAQKTAKRFAVTPSNSLRFEFNQDEYALSIAADDDGYRNLMLFRKESGTWYAYAPYIDADLNNEKILAYGSVSNYLIAMLPKANQMLHAVADVVPPANKIDKVACAAYDIAMDLEFDPIAKVIQPNKTPPFSHTNLPAGT